MTFFWCALISVQRSEGMGGWEEEEGWEGTQPTIQHRLQQEKSPKVATLSHTIPQGQGGV